MGCCDEPDLRWSLRLRVGVVQYNLDQRPTSAQARAGIAGLDGGDYSAGVAQGHARCAVDGGDLSDPAWQWPASPLVADGGSWS